MLSIFAGNRYKCAMKSDLRYLFIDALAVLKCHWVIYTICPSLLAGLALFLFPFDPHVTEVITTRYFNRFWWFYAGELSHYGAFERASVYFILVLLIVGFVKKRRDWRRAALACLLACIFAGALVNLSKSLTGRPRPNAGVEQDGFYGPHLENDYRSFPSAHATTAFATATSLALAFPALTVPLFVFEGAVALSRIYVKGHYLVDVLVGSGVGIWFGRLFGRAYRKRTALLTVKE